MSHDVFIRHTYIYKCSSCDGEWKINDIIPLNGNAKYAKKKEMNKFGELYL